MRLLLTLALLLTPILSSPARVRPQLPIANNIEYETRASVQYRIVTSARRNSVDIDTALRVAACESGFDAYATNPNSSGLGVYQFLDGTWDYIGSPGDRLNAQDNIDAFMKTFVKHPEWWYASRKCWDTTYEETR